MRRISIFLLCIAGGLAALAFAPQHASAAIAIDATSSYVAPSTGSSTFTWNHTIAASDEVLVVGESDSCFPRIYPTSLTFDGAALTMDVTTNTIGTYGKSALWHIVNPDVGTHAITATYSGTQCNGTDFVGISFSGVDQTNPIDATSSLGGTASTNASTTITTVADGDYIVDAGATQSSNGAPVPGAGQTAIFVYKQFKNDTGYYSYKGLVSPPGSTVMSWSGNASFPWDLVAVALKPAKGFGFDFRATAGYVTDPSDDTPVLCTAYPTSTTLDGYSVTYGWSAPVSCDSRDRSSSADPRLAGINFPGAGNPASDTFQVTLPSTGLYDINAAFGDYSNTQTVYATLYDGSAATGTVILQYNGSSSATFLDASGNDWSSANWPFYNVPKQHTFSTNTATLVMGGGGSSNSSVVAHIHFIPLGGSPPPTPSFTRYAFPQVIAINW